MNNHITEVNELKAYITVFISALTALWGWYGWLIVFWVFAMAIDVVTGMASAGIEGRWSSSVARNGLWHKAGEIFVLLAAALVDLGIRAVVEFTPDINLPFRYTVLLGPVVVAWYLVTEVGSIVENAEKMGAPVPKWLLHIICATKEKIDEGMDVKDNMED